MKKLHLSEKDRVVVVTLVVLLFFSIVCFCAEFKNIKENEKSIANTVPVIATVEDIALEYREEVQWNSGAGDDVDKEVIQVPYYVYRLMYTHEGKEYRIGYTGYIEGDSEIGAQVQLMIDSTDPLNIIDNTQKKRDFFFGWMFLVIFAAVFVIWLLVRSRRKKDR